MEKELNTDTQTALLELRGAAKYIRLSYTDDKSNESNSVGNQRKLIEDFVSRHPEIELVSEKVDDGYSGVIFDRPAFKEMMDDIMEGKINCVIVKDLSRLGREYIETGRYMRRVFPAYGVRFIAINDNIDTLNESAGDDLTVSVKNIMNEAYARDISIKTRSSLETKRKNGDFVGAFPVYGYRKSEENHNLLVVDEYAAQVVRSIFRMRLEGFSPYAIANELNRLGTLSPLAYKKYYGLPHAKKGYTDRKDCRWSANTVTRILQDETYTGTLVQGRKGSQHFKLKEMESRPSSEWIRVENEPLLIGMILTWYKGFATWTPVHLPKKIKSICFPAYWSAAAAEAGWYVKPTAIKTKSITITIVLPERRMGALIRSW